MTNNEFESLLRSKLDSFSKAVATDEGEWIVKGFIDIYKNIYTISIDTKIVSKVIEILLFPMLQQFAEENGFTFYPPKHQNFYPDATFQHKKSGKLFAVDLKTSYRKSPDAVNGMTLGAFTGYFRNRTSTKNIEHPYKDYSGHYALGVIYSQSEKFIDEKNKFTLDELESIPSVIHDFQFFVQPKYKIAKDQPGSGNTKNIGGITNIHKLVNGKGPFSELGESIFDDFWMYYLTKDMAKALEIPRPYTNLKSFMEYKKKGIDLLEAKEDLIRSFEDDDTANEDEE